jgi:hypothetical protein
MATNIANAAANAEADALARQLDTGYLRIYSGVQPATADTALSGNTLLAELRYSATSAPAASAGVLTFNAITGDSSADATGTATFFRALQSNGTSVVMDGVASGPAGSMTSITRSGQVATATTAASHGYATGDQITIAGAAQAEYNGVRRITVTAATTFTYLVSGAPATPATGTITHTNADLNLNSASITAGSSVTVSSFVHTVPKS